ncbi:Methylated-DNA--protein-cysteine methyltransferase [[Actinomadura] parvosata subsp. kistnae]|uniref:Methylated-DNA--protein-cysteine methyltransferase n=1 Tax=[Actinomadura] parvosata subsp. kistnae TaxID=1909395 RepID=A0A1V0A7Y8_9ACTN|nr:methylated-DNA--[protein]-cysteine S-methyltransferase [Nonomuraea sp. ATCC 55076]AQZ66325.1 cysteine methyltransferase [Nonomuraea sp. ATCC 55076]SPL95657.1 Methylated-DNA--protein-cysteine methyltransferase [Actinomadura parvosata subsp. kistnae]
MDIYTTIDSPLGEILLVGDGTALTRLSFAPAAPHTAGLRRDDLKFAEAARQLGEYFAGERTAFDLPLRPRGSTFQERVWTELAGLPYGTTTSYGALAARIGAPADRIRAVGAAVGANPLLVLLPCHRVVAADGALTGYAAGLERKRALLTLEGVLQPQLWSTL